MRSPTRNERRSPDSLGGEDGRQRPHDHALPPSPGGILDQPAEPGLRVTYAGEGFLLATKLIAQRAKDADDVVALAGRLGVRFLIRSRLLTDEE